MQNLKFVTPNKIVLIGASTGGPGQIQKIIHALPKLQNTTIVIGQHMIEGFIDSFAKRLQNNSHNTISVVQNHQIFESACIYLCEGHTNLKINRSEMLFNHEVSTLHSYNPNINILFNSFVPLCKDVEILSVILTGIGDDGIKACVELSTNGAKCVTETQESAIVDGMPNRARLLVPNVQVEAMDNIVKIVSEFCN